MRRNCVNIFKNLFVHILKLDFITNKQMMRSLFHSLLDASIGPVSIIAIMIISRVALTKIQCFNLTTSQANTNIGLSQNRINKSLLPNTLTKSFSNF